MPRAVFPGLPDSEAEKNLLNQPGRCPYCESTELTATDYDGEADLSVKVECASCQAEWTECYRLVGMIESPDRVKI